MEHYEMICIETVPYFRLQKPNEFSVLTIEKDCKHSDIQTYMLSLCKSKQYIVDIIIHYIYNYVLYSSKREVNIGK